MADTIGQLEVTPEFAVGAVLSKTFSTFFANLGTFLLFAFVVLIPATMMTTFYTGSIFAQSATNPAAVADVFGLSFLLAWLLSLASTAVVLVGTVDAAIKYQTGQSVSFGGMFDISIRRLVPAVIAVVVGYILVILGMVLLVIPGMIIAIMMSTTIAAIAAEGAGPIEAMRRSRELTSGYKWQILGILFVITGVIIVLQVVMASIAVAVGLGPGLAVGAQSANVTAFSIALALSGLIQSTIGYALIGACIASVFTGLKESKEGVDTEEVANIFA